MLKNLNISNYILIEDVFVSFKNNLTIITGETGAGKSILLGALKLIMAERAELGVLRNKEKKCVVEATFDISALNLEEYFNENELDYQTETIIRREILPNGKSRIFINDSPVTLTIAQLLTLELIDIHSQFSNNQLKNPVFFLSILDSFNKNSELKEYKEKFKIYQSNLKKLEKLEKEFAENTSQKEYNTFLFDELEKAQLKENEQSDLEIEQGLLQNSEEIILALNYSSSILERETSGILFNLNEVVNSLNKIEKNSLELVEINKRILSTKIELTDTSNEILDFIQNLEINPARLLAIKSRLDLIYSLQNKHKTNTVKDLIELQNNLKISSTQLEEQELELTELKNLTQEFYLELNALASKLSKERVEASKIIEKELEATLAKLGIENASFSFEFENQELNQTGKDKVKLNFSANKGVDFKPLDKIASGGEIARISLAIKKIISSKVNLPTLVLDEIDTGISGRVANQMGDVLREMANYIQIFNITHNPQIASKGKHHLKVYKETQENETKTYIKELNQEEKISEIAQLISGEKISDLAIAQAKELLKG